MIRFVWGQIVNRPSRPAVLALTVLVSASAFVLLTAAGATTETRVTGSVESNYRTAYDILVRPQGSATPLERSEGLVRDNYLSGLFGGISIRQWRSIKGIPSVEVAAPIANVGFFSFGGRALVKLDPLLNDDPVQLYRITFGVRAHRGTSRYQSGTAYVYYNRTSTAFEPGYQMFRELPEGAGGPELEVCSFFHQGAPPRTPPFTRHTSLSCFFERSPGRGSDSVRWGSANVGIGPGEVGAYELVRFPILVAGIDPVEEARLLQLDDTVVRGRYLRADDEPHLVPIEEPTSAGAPPSFRKNYRRVVAAIASTRTYVDETVDVTIERLRIPDPAAVPWTLASPQAYAFATSLPGRVVDRRRIGPQHVYETVLEGIATKNEVGGGMYHTASPVAYSRGDGGRLVPRSVRNPRSIWRASAAPDGAPLTETAVSNADVQFRRLEGLAASRFFVHEVPGEPQSQVAAGSSFEVVGHYDPELLPSFSPLSEVPLETYYPPTLEPADEASRMALGGEPLLPTQNVGDYVAQPPLFLTTIEGVRPFLDTKYYAKASPEKPISVIRVRVRGASGADAVGRARIEAAAAAIHERTGLRVDITAGSSPQRREVELPPGQFGRPQLVLSEGWSKKGVSVSFLEALDRKRLALFSLVLLACSFFLANGAFAVVRARRQEIGTLLCIGWTQRAIFVAVLGELALVGLAAGAAGAILAWQLAGAFELAVSVGRLVAVVPLAVLLSVGVGLVPAARAARLRPLDAVRPQVAGETKGSRIRSLAALARANVLRAPARSVVAAAGLFVGVYALTVLLAVNDAFQGSLVGSVLGEAISIDVRGLDFVSVALVIVLAGLSLADVLYLNLRERAAELATLRTLGWRERHLALVVALEALWLGLAGSVAGALAGIATAWPLGVPLAPVAAWAAAAAAGGVAIALLATLLPLARLATITPPRILAEE